MVIFGKKSPVLRKEQLFGKKCPHCNTIGSVEMRVIADYAHVYWIPFFPLRKKGVSFCQHCRQTLDYKQMPQSFQTEFDLMKSEVKTPVWQFVGISLLALLIGFGIHAGIKSDQNSLLYLGNPQVGDVYRVKAEGGGYSLLKVAEINGDTVRVLTNELQVTKLTKLHSINKPENFNGPATSFHKSNLIKMHEDGDLINVKR